LHRIDTVMEEEMTTRKKLLAGALALTALIVPAASLADLPKPQPDAAAQTSQAQASQAPDAATATAPAQRGPSANRNCDRQPNFVNQRQPNRMDRQDRWNDRRNWRDERRADRRHGHREWSFFGGRYGDRDWDRDGDRRHGRGDWDRRGGRGGGQQAVPAAPGTVPPPQNGLFGNGTAPKAQVD